MWDLLNSIVWTIVVLFALLILWFQIPIWFAEKAFYNRQWTPEDAELELRKLKRALQAEGSEGSQAKLNSLNERIDYLEVKVLRPKPPAPAKQPSEVETLERELADIENVLQRKADRLAAIDKVRQQLKAKHPDDQTSKGLRHQLDILLDNARRRALEMD